MLARTLVAASCLFLAACGAREQQPVAAPTAVIATSVPATPSPDISPTMQAKRDLYARQPITLVFEGQQWQPDADELGATVAVNSDVLQVTVDQAKLRVYLEQLAPEVAQAPVDAQISVNGAEVVVSPSVVGRELDLDSTLTAATTALKRATPVRVTLATVPVEPQIDDAAAQTAQARVSALLAQPFEVVVGKQTYTWQAEQLAPLITLQPEAKSQSLVTFDQTGLNQLVAELAETSVQSAREPRVGWNNNKLGIIAPGTNGARVDEAQAVAVVLDALASGEPSAKLPLQELRPQVTADKLDSLGIKEVVSVGKSDFSGSASYRITNILAGMKLLNGTLVPPGEEFSFNNTIGEINAANGFVEGYAIIQNRTQLEFGGGICQDSTTVFRAAFWAGLPITERKEHSFYISWYDKYGLGPQGNGPGLDAAIFTGVQDLRFVNDTGAWLMIEATANTNTTTAQVTLYGTKPDREVSLTHKIVKKTPAITTPEYFPDPKQPRGTVKRTDTARGGMQIQVFRMVTENGVKREPELFSTSFKPWPNKYAVNPADLNADGIPVFFAPAAPVAPTADPALAPTADPNVPLAPTADPNIPQPPAPTADPNLFPPAPTANPNLLPPAPTPDPNVLPAPAVDPNAPPAEPTADPNVPPPAG